MISDVLKPLKYLSLLVWSAAAILPLLAVGFASFKTQTELQTSGPFTLPKQFNFQNYATAFNDGRMASGFVNTMIILAFSITGTVIIGAMTAYALDRFDFHGKKIVYGAFLLAILVPGVTTQVATFQVVNKLGLYDSLLAPIVLYMGTDIVSIYIFLQFIKAIPKELDESAMLEGAGHFRVFWQIIFPLLKPAIATVVIIKGFASYNEFYIPFLYMPSQDHGVISTSLFRFMGPFGAHWEIISAGVVIVILPTLVTFLFLQRYIYNGYTQGAVK